MTMPPAFRQAVGPLPMRVTERCTHWARSLMADIAERFPAVHDHLPGEPLHVAVTRRAHVSPELHFIVNDRELRDRARALIAEAAPHIVHDASDDAVLIVAPVY